MQDHDDNVRPLNARTAKEQPKPTFQTAKEPHFQPYLREIILRKFLRGSYR